MKPVTWLERLFKNQGVQRLREILTAAVERPIIGWEIPGEAPKSLDYTQACRTCHFVRNRKNRLVCQKQFLEVLTHVHQTRAPKAFLCPIQRHALCLPLVRSDQVQGYLAICHSQSAWSDSLVKLGFELAQAAGREMERSDELKNLSDAIGPRCVALSTIHTIHRLISSTLDLQELLPRMARLSCQVLRATSCAIWLTDDRRRFLIPRARIELTRVKSSKGINIQHGRAIPIGKGLIGQVALTCEARLTKRWMVVPLVEEDCLGVIWVKRGPQAQPFGTLDQEILTTLAEQAVVAIRNAQMYENQERVTWGTIRSLSAILDGMENRAASKKSSNRQILADVSLAVAQEMKVPVLQQRPLQYAALLHDAGRVGIPKEILHKSSPLEPAEFAKVREHPMKGARILKPFEILEPAIPIIMHHHERFDGTGYPKGLKREAIPLGARILAVANAFEAMVGHRPYRRSLSIQQAAREIASHAGTQFDPKVVEAFGRLIRSKKLETLMGAA